MKVSCNHAFNRHKEVILIKLGKMNNWTTNDLSSNIEQPTLYLLQYTQLRTLT